MVTRLWKYPLLKTCVAGTVGYIAFGIADTVDSSPLLDDSEKWRKFRSDFYNLYFKLTGIIGKRHYIEDQYLTDIPGGSYLRCAVDSLEKAHQIISFDNDEKLRRRILRKAHRYAIKAASIEEDDDLRSKSHKWYGLIMLKRAKYGNREKRLLKAASEFEKAVVVDSTDPIVWMYLGVIKYELGEYQQAINCHLRAQKLKQSNCPQANYHVGLAQEQLNTPESRSNACTAFEKVLMKHCDSIADTVVRRSAVSHLRECEAYL